jgi:hypothetical protein
MQFAPDALVAGAAFFLPKIDLSPASWDMALLAVFVAVLVAFAVGWPPTELAAPAIAVRLPAAFPEGPHAGSPLAPPACMGDAPEYTGMNQPDQAAKFREATAKQ